MFPLSPRAPRVAPFPTDAPVRDPNEITLRDWFAGQALAGTLAAVDAEDVRRMASMSTEQRAAEFAHHAYLMADAMIEERSRE